MRSLFLKTFIIKVVRTNLSDICAIVIKNTLISCLSGGGRGRESSAPSNPPTKTGFEYNIRGRLKYLLMKLLDAVKYLAPVHKQLSKYVQVFLTDSLLPSRNARILCWEFTQFTVIGNFWVHQKLSTSCEASGQARDVKNSWRKVG